MRFVESINNVLGKILENHEEVILYGEDLLDPYGGAFKVTKGLSSKFPNRVLSTPIHIRLEKISNSDDYEISHLLDEEKFILDSQEEQNERTEMILSATINGKSKFLESLAENHKIKKVVIRFLSEVDEIVGADLEKYGPFKAEDIATIPYENAQALIAKKIATKVRWED